MYGVSRDPDEQRDPMTMRLEAGLDFYSKALSLKNH